MQVSILRLLVSGSENKTAYKSRRWSLQPTPDDFEYLASNAIDERIRLVPSGPVTKVRVAKVSEELGLFLPRVVACFPFVSFLPLSSIQNLTILLVLV